MLLFADDQAILAENEDNLQQAVYRLKDFQGKDPVPSKISADKKELV
jgi:hypothetical protein